MSKTHNDALPLETIASLLYDAENDLLDEIRAFASNQEFEESKVNGKPNGFNVACCKHPQGSNPLVHDDGDAYVCKNGVVQMYPQNKTQNKDCPWKDYISKTKKNRNKWKVTDTSFQALKEHSHELEPGTTNIYASYRRRNRAGPTQVAIIQDAQNGIPPAQTVAHLDDSATSLRLMAIPYDCDIMNELVCSKKFLSLRWLFGRWLSSMLGTRQISTSFALSTLSVLVICYLQAPRTDYVHSILPLLLPLTRITCHTSGSCNAWRT
ncbi:hypothetical protein BJV82DRAFT_134778 [Fennellomyces sp. T-0311]|nr:hypothetical protein BJV82DRAFT_134778 [Fennellomyces sp. T-0311]